MNPVTTAVQHASFDLQILNALHKTMVYALPVRNDVDSLPIVRHTITFSLALCNPPLSFKFSEDERNLFEIWTWCCHRFPPGSAEIESLCTKLLCCLFTYWRPFPTFHNHHTIPHYQLALQKDHTYLNAISNLSERDQSDCELPHQDKSRCVWMFRSVTRAFHNYFHQCGEVH